MAYKQELWDEAKKKCHLGDEEIRMAKEMGLNPKSLIKNIPNKKKCGKLQSRIGFTICMKKDRKKQSKKLGKNNKGNNERI